PGTGGQGSTQGWSGLVSVSAIAARLTSPTHPTAPGPRRPARRAPPAPPATASRLRVARPASAGEAQPSAARAGDGEGRPGQTLRETGRAAPAGDIVPRSWHGRKQETPLGICRCRGSDRRLEGGDQPARLVLVPRGDGDPDLSAAIPGGLELELHQE